MLHWWTEGYPFFLQEYGKAVWNIAESSPITEADAREARHVVDAVLDQDFFSLRVGNLPDREIDYIKALASLGPGEHTPDIAKAMRARSSASIGTFSRRLTERGLIYNTKRGRVAFTRATVRQICGPGALTYRPALGCLAKPRL